jgi:hypothetical protein
LVAFAANPFAIFRAKLRITAVAEASLPNP